MDASRFDSLTRHWATRRTAFGGLVFGLIGLTSLDADAKQGKHRKRKRKRSRNHADAEQKQDGDKHQLGSPHCDFGRSPQHVSYIPSRRSP